MRERVCLEKSTDSLISFLALNLNAVPEVDKAQPNDPVFVKLEISPCSPVRLVDLNQKSITKLSLAKVKSGLLGMDKYPPANSIDDNPN